MSFNNQALNFTWAVFIFFIHLFILKYIDGFCNVCV